MKFGNSSDFKSSMDTYIRRMGRTFMMPVTTLVRKGRNLAQPNSIARKATNDVMQEVKKLKEPPKTIQAYVFFGEHYIAKRLLYLLVLLLLVTPALVLNYVFPLIQSKFLVKTMPVDSVGIASYSGKVRLTDRDTKTLLFLGDMEDGRLSGSGQLYDYDGFLLYTGGFQMEMYHGYGELFYPSGRLSYRGNFALNKYEGQGVLYYENGNICYEGGFLAGQYEGVGSLYYADGKKQYEGGFEKGLYSGRGILYDSQERLVYSGQFEQGDFSGTGVLYLDGQILYEGDYSGILKPDIHYHIPGRI